MLLYEQVDASPTDAKPVNGIQGVDIVIDHPSEYHRDIDGIRFHLTWKIHGSISTMIASRAKQPNPPV